MNGPSEQDEADLAALADGALYGPRRAELQRRLTAEPDLAAAYERQCAAVRLLASCHDRAPLGLRLRVEELQAQRPTSRRRWWPTAALAFAATVAAFLVLLAGRGPAVEDVLAVALLPATAPAVDGRPLGEWNPAGARTDVIDGREVRTVFYARDGRTIAYAIVNGPALSKQDALRIVRADEVVAVTWTEDGRTCILAERDGDPDALARLALW